MKKIKLLAKLGSLCLKRKLITNEGIGNAYTEVSGYYEAYFLSKMHRYNDLVLDELKKERAETVENILDLACGTGYNSARLKKDYPNAHFHLVDISEGMLEQAKKKGLEPATYTRQDMLGFLKEQANESFDVVVCGWAIKYQSPQKIIKEVYRVLKPGGVFGVIVNTKETLSEIRKIYPELLVMSCDEINEVMLELPNPQNKKVFDRWFTKAGFTYLNGEEGKHTFYFENEKKLTQWVTHTGALAGFDHMIDLTSEKIQYQMHQLLKEQGINKVTHTFVWGSFKK